MNDDLKMKTDDELKSIVQSSRANQHVPTSIYHSAKEELEVRAEKVSEQQKELELTAKAVLLSISESKYGTDAAGKFVNIEILENLFSKKRMQKVKEALQWLIDQDLVEEIEDHKEVYRLTPFGRSHLNTTRIESNVTNYSNISHSNIAHESDNINQTINIDELSEDVQKSMEELRIAASKRDASGMKKAFAYLADKAVDVAIMITLGHLKL